MVFSYFTISVKGVATLFSVNETCIATVVNRTEFKYKHRIRHRSVTSFTTRSGKKVQRIYENENQKIGDYYELLYNEKQDIIVTNYISIFIGFFVRLFFTTICVLLLLMLFRFILGLNLGPYLIFIQKIGLWFVLPLLLIGFNGLLILGVFYGNEGLLVVSIILWFFIIVLTISIYFYFKELLKGNIKIDTR